MYRKARIALPILVGAALALATPVAATAAEPASKPPRTVGQKLDDTTLTASIKTQLLANKSVSGTAINVTTRNGIVTLTGQVSSESERELAGQIAESNAPAGSVRNELTVAGE